MAAVTICSDFGAQKIKSDTVSTVSPSISHEVMGPDAMILVFWMLSFKPEISKYPGDTKDTLVPNEDVLFFSFWSLLFLAQLGLTTRLTGR